MTTMPTMTTTNDASSVASSTTVTDGGGGGGDGGSANNLLLSAAVVDGTVEVAGVRATLPAGFTFPGRASAIGRLGNGPSGGVH